MAKARGRACWSVGRLVVDWKIDKGARYPITVCMYVYMYTYIYILNMCIYIYIYIHYLFIVALFFVNLYAYLVFLNIHLYIYTFFLSLFAPDPGFLRLMTVAMLTGSALTTIFALVLQARQGT